jgi:hypothetical protein
MKVKVTVTITYETHLRLEDYADAMGDDGAVRFKREEEILEHELELAKYDDGNSDLVDAAIGSGNISDVKIEKIEETAEAKEEAA